MAKEARYDLRGDEQQKQVIAMAAKLTNKSLSQFIIDNAYQEAINILADRQDYKLSEDQWEAFINVLDAEPKPVQELRKLLRKKSVFDQD